MLRKELRDGSLQSLLGGSSYLVSSSNTTEPDPLLSSFIFNSPKVDEPVSAQSQLFESTSVRESSNENLRERYVCLPSIFSSFCKVLLSKNN